MIHLRVVCDADRCTAAALVPLPPDTWGRTSETTTWIQGDLLFGAGWRVFERTVDVPRDIVLCPLHSTAIEVAGDG